MKTKTLMLKEKSGQLIITPEVYKCYSNVDYKVYRSFFDEPDYIVVRKSDNAALISRDYRMQSLSFDLEFISAF